MTKHEFLEKLINKKDTWQSTMPVFKESDEIITITKNMSYQGMFQIITEGDVLFECLVETLKNIITPIQPYISTKKPIIEYRIDTKDLKLDYIYEDQLICYYPGGTMEINIKFIVVEEQVKVISNTENLKVSNWVTPKKKNNVEIQLSKLTFNLDDVILLNIDNYSNRPRHLVFECDLDIITPKITEVFLNDHWSQEWYLKKTMVDRLFRNLSFRNEPFKDIVIKGYLDNESNPSYSIKTAITSYETYVTNQNILNDHMYQKTKLNIFRQYIEMLVSPTSKKESSKIVDLIKACINFNQKDLELRLFLIWILIEYGHKKEAKNEMMMIEKYNDYYSTYEQYELIVMMQGIISKDTLSIHEIFEHVNENSYWLELLAKARYTSSRNSRYNYYKALFQKGVRKSFLFAEVVTLLNQLPIIPDEDDELYVVSLKWALNKKCISSSWLLKIERHYYQLEKNPYMTSHLSYELYQLKKSKNLLRLFCQSAISEERYDQIAFEGYKEALKSKIYIKELDNHYIYASWQVKEDIDLDLLKHFTKIQHLAKPIQEYIYLSVVKKRAFYSLLYRRLFNEIMTYLQETKTYTTELIQICSYLFDDMINDKNETLFNLFTTNSIELMFEDSVGKDLIVKIVDYAMSEKTWFSQEQKTKLIKRIVHTIGFEGLYQIHEFKEQVVVYFDEISKNERQGYFLTNSMYKERFWKYDASIEFYKKIVTDDFIDILVSKYFELEANFRKSIRNSFIYYISRRIVVGYENVDDIFLEEMYTYYVESEKKPIWLLLAIVQGLSTANEDLISRVRNLYEEGQKHDIIVPWFNDEVFDEDEKMIHYLSHPEDQMNIFYRFHEDEKYQSSKMKHLAFGVFIFQFKLFYGEYFEYYIQIEEKSGRRYVPHSDLIKNEMLNQNSLLIENEYSIEQRLDNITLSYELNDDLSAKVFIEEQIQFNNKINRLLKL